MSDKFVRGRWESAVDCRFRQLTPLECFRLQGISDDYFERAEFVNSDNQLYKQVGNACTVPVIKAIAGRLVDDTSA